MYPYKTIERVVAATDLVALIQEQVALVRNGTEYIGRCPFHDDDGSSLHVSPGKQIYKCFSCGPGGDVIFWMMKSSKVTFIKAVQVLAHRSGIDLAEGKSHDA
jgi:DNA primase